MGYIIELLSARLMRRWILYTFLWWRKRICFGV